MHVTPELLAQIDALRVQVADQLGESARNRYLRVNEDELSQLASGFVPTSVVAMAQLALAEVTGLADQRRADRPVPTRTKK